jgi:hypothetical protein
MMKKNWKIYKGPFTITSNEVIANNAVNSDYTVTIYAKGKDSAGNEIIEKKKILNLDLDAPKTPVITSNYGYPILTEYGVKADGKTSINYDTRKDITNYYSIDGGKTWNNYTGDFQYVQSGTIYAKSIKNSTGLETITSKTVTQPSDALAKEAYDENESSYIVGRKYAELKRYLLIDSNMSGKSYYILTGCSSGSDATGRVTVKYYNDNNIEIGTEITINSGIARKTDVINIPENATKMLFIMNASGGWSGGEGYACIYEIGNSNEPKIELEKQSYPVLTKDGVVEGYCTTKISYFSTSVQRLYKINNTGWQTYQNKSIKLESGQTLYAKGIDKNGKETRTISSYTATLPNDALAKEAYDKNNSSYVFGAKYSKLEKYMLINPNMVGKDYYIVTGCTRDSSPKGYVTVKYYNDTTLIGTEKIINSGINNKTSIMKIPENATKMLFTMYASGGWSGGEGYARIYELGPSN